MTRTKQILYSPFIVAFIVFLVGVVVTVLTWQTTSESSEQTSSSTVQAATQDFATRFETRFEAYVDVIEELSEGAVRQGISKTTFDNSVGSLDLVRSYPSIDTISYVAFVDSKNESALKMQLAGEGLPNFVIFPNNTNSNKAPLVYVKSATNQQVVENLRGYDLFSDSSLKKMFDKAIASNSVVVGEPISVTGKEGSSQRGVAMAGPVKKNNQTIGFFLVTVNTERLAELLEPNKAFNVSINVFADEKVVKKSLLAGTYESDAINPKRSKIKVAGSTWLIQGFSNNEKGDNSLVGENKNILISGFAISALLSLFLLFVIRNKSLELDLRKSLEVQKAKENLLSLASHQLRTPATGVKQYLGMVLEGFAGEITDKQRDMLEKANLSNERQLSIVNQILKISKLENKQIPLTLTMIDPVKLAEDVINEQQQLLAGRNVEIVSPKEELLVPLDKIYFRMVIDNLLNNAAKYSHEDSNIKIEFAEDDNNFIMKVVDNGIGIDRKDFHKLFKAFSRIDNEFTFTVSGTGIGLYIDKMIVELHGGSIDVESEIGVGTTFTVTIPMLTERPKKEN